MGGVCGELGILRPLFNGVHSLITHTKDRSKRRGTQFTIALSEQNVKRKKPNFDSIRFVVNFGGCIVVMADDEGDRWRITHTKQDARKSKRQRSKVTLTTCVISLYPTVENRVYDRCLFPKVIDCRLAAFKFIVLID